MKKILVVLLSLICLIPLASCNSKEVKEKKILEKKIEESRELNIPYSKEDTLNPYYLKSTLNKSIVPLIYDSLYTVDSSYKAVESVASSADVSKSSVSVTLNSGKCFEDGSAITASDVVHSFDLAKASHCYSKSLINIEQARSKGSFKIQFTLDKADKNILSCLNFPIIKSGTSADVEHAFPKASGKYKIVLEDNKRVLKPNEKFSGYDSKTKKINLVNITDSSAINHTLAIGNIDTMFTDFSSGENKRINAETKKVMMNNFVFLAINEKNEKLSDPKLRKAISTVLDREKIAKESFRGYATESYTMFNPNWYELKSVKIPGKNADKAKAIKYIEDYIEENAKDLTVTLVVNSDNKFKVACGSLISQTLDKVGIKVTVKSLPTEQYIESYNKSNYDLFLGEMKLSNDMSLYGLLTPKTPSFESYSKYQEGTVTTADFLKEYYEQLPVIPLCFRNGILAYTKSTDVKEVGNENNVYGNISNWYIK